MECVCYFTKGFISKIFFCSSGAKNGCDWVLYFHFTKELCGYGEKCSNKKKEIDRGIDCADGRKLCANKRTVQLFKKRKRKRNVVVLILLWTTNTLTPQLCSLADVILKREKLMASAVRVDGGASVRGRD